MYTWRKDWKEMCSASKQNYKLLGLGDDLDTFMNKRSQYYKHVGSPQINVYI